MPNPFFFAGKITQVDQFVGREQELRKIFGYLNVAQTGQIQHVAVVGERRIGKSSLLYHLSQVYAQNLPQPEQYRLVYVDLDRPQCQTQAGFFRYLLEQLEVHAPAELTQTRFYDLIEQQHEQHGLWPVFLLDEFEHLPQRAAEFPDGFYETLRSLGNNNLAGLVTASQHSLQSLATAGKLTSPFFNIFHQLELKEFTAIEANALLNRGRVSDQAFTEPECAEILKIAGQRPACLQVVASLVYETKSSGNQPDWSAIKAEALKEPPFTNGVPQPQPTLLAWFWSALKWVSVSLPKMTGRAFLDFIGRDKAVETTAWIFGALILLVVAGFIVGVIPWPLITKYLKALLGLIIK